MLISTGRLGQPWWLVRQPRCSSGHPQQPLGPVQQLYPGIGQAVASCWSPVSEWLLPCQQEPSGGRGQKSQPCFQNGAMLHPTHHCPCLYKAFFFVFLSRKNTARHWRRLCLSRHVSQSLTQDLQPLVQLKNSLSTPWREQASRAGCWPASPSPCQNLQEEGKSNSSWTNLLHPLCSVSGGGIQLTNLTSSYVKGEALFYYYFFNSPPSPFGDLLCP